LFWEDACGFSVGVVVVEAEDQAFAGQHSQALSGSAPAFASIWEQAPVRFRHGLNIRWCNFQIALDLGFKINSVKFRRNNGEKIFYDLVYTAVRYKLMTH